MRLVFAGTPAAAVPSLDALLRSRHEVAAVLTRPDFDGLERRLASLGPVRRIASQAAASANPMRAGPATVPPGRLCASVIGSQVSLALLGSVANVPAPALGTCLASLDAAGLLARI